MNLAYKTPLISLRNLHNISANAQRWQYRFDDMNIVQDMINYLELPETLARTLAGRGINAENAPSYLNPTLRETLPNPFELKDMEQATARIIKAIHKCQNICIFGDYDVDGATSTALLIRYFAMLGVKAEYYIPDRISEGYGPNAPALLKLKQQDIDLVITVDCGAVAFAPLKAASEAGLDVIVVDHHKGAAELPIAVANVNPNRLDEHNPNTHLAAVGVCFLLCVAMNKALRESGYFANKPEPNLMHLLDLVALGTVCDVVALRGINRTFVKQGLKIMQSGNNAGMAALLKIAGVDDEQLTAYHLGFVLGPRINAGGRVGESSLGVRLLTSNDTNEIEQIAVQLNQYNLERQAIEANVLEMAMIEAGKQSNYDVIMVAGHGWHEGVIGIVASRLKDRFNRPAIVVSLSDAKGKASARSVSGVDIGASIVAARECGLIVEGGGHAMAGGFSFKPETLNDLHQFMITQMQAGVGRYLENQTLKIDAPINCAMVNHTTLKNIEQAAPFGMGNPSPLLVIYDAVIQNIDILKEQHLRLFLSDNSKGRVKAMCFRAIGTPLGEFLLQMKGKNIHIAGTLSENNWQGSSSIDFHIVDAMLA
jgi:single-stranded-DNA-specific exonuclease